MASPYLPDDIVIIFAELLHKEDRDGVPLLYNLRSFIEVNKQFYRCGIPYLYFSYANTFKRPNRHPIICQVNGRPTFSREVTSLWPFARALLGSPDLGKHVRRIVHTRKWEVNNKDKISLAFADKCPELVFKHFPALSPQSEEAARYQDMLDQLSKSSSVVRTQLQDDPMTNPAFGPTCELADFIAILTKTPNLEELRFIGDCPWLEDMGPPWPADYPITYPWSSVLSEVPHKLAHLRTVDLRDTHWGFGQCYHTVSYFLTLPAIDSLKFNFGRDTAVPNCQWLCPSRSSNLRSLDLTTQSGVSCEGHEQFSTLLFSSCRELEYVKFDFGDHRGESTQSMSAILGILAKYHHRSLQSLSIGCRIKRRVPTLNLSAFSALRHLKIGIYPRAKRPGPAEFDTHNILNNALPSSLETLLIKRAEKNLMQYVREVMKSVKDGSLPNLKWIFVAQWQMSAPIDQTQQDENGSTSTEEWDQAYMGTVFDSVDFDWSFNNLLTCFPSFVHWQVEAYSRSACYSDIRKRHSKGFMDWARCIYN